MLIVWVIVTVIGLVAVVYLLIDRSLSAPRHHGPTSDHFDGTRFHNLEPPNKKGFVDLLRWQLTSKRGAWNRWTESESSPSPPTKVIGNELRVTFINHATVLIQTGGLNILTDPIWSERASPFTWAGPKRHRAPGIRLEELPPIDVVLISHNHYDHLDMQTLAKLDAKHHPRLVTGLGNAALLTAGGINHVVELDWWQVTKISDALSVTCVPAKHFSGRGLSDGDATLWCGYVMQTPAGNIYFAGDTGMGTHFAEIKKRFQSFRLVLLPIGAYLPRWFMHPVHISPSDAVELHHQLQPRVSMAIHFGTFALGDDGELEPVLQLRKASNSDSNFWVLKHGEGRDVPS